MRLQGCCAHPTGWHRNVYGPCNTGFAHHEKPNPLQFNRADDFIATGPALWPHGRDAPERPSHAFRGMSASGRSTRGTFRFSDPPLLLLALLLLAVFMLSRLPFFWYYPSARLAQDTTWYLEIVTTIRGGHWPRFTYRPPGYPLLFWFVTLFTDRWIAVIYAQNLLSYASSLFLVYSVRRYRASLALPATLAMCGFLGSSQVVLYDVALLSDSLYTSSVITAVALLLLAFRGFGPFPLAIASAAMAWCILVRPSGEYFIVIYAIVLAYLVWQRQPVLSVVAFSLPFPALVLALCAYNYATISCFVVSSLGEANLVGATALFWEPDPRLPDSVNLALKDLPASYARQDITLEDLQTLQTSWDADRLNLIYEKAFNRLIFSEGWGWTRLGTGDYLSGRANMRAASLIAIRRHPVLYAKFVWVGLVEYFRGVGYKFDIESSIAYRKRGNPLSEMGGTHPDETAARLVASSNESAPATVLTGNEAASGQERFVKGLQHQWQRLHGVIFQNIAWSYIYFIVLALSAVQFMRSKAGDKDVFLMFVLTLIPLGASLIVSLVVISADRYSYPTQFLYYLCVVLTPLLFGRIPRAAEAYEPSNRVRPDANG
jgi:hypothetical protein